MIMISENATTKNLHIERNPWCNCEKQEYHVFHSITITELQHQHNQCKFWSITKERHFKLMLNIQPFTYCLAVYMWSWSSFQFFTNLQIYPNHKSNYIPRKCKTYLYMCINIQKERKNGTHVCSLKVKVIKWIQNF